jgi:flavin reductase (DIM6/NTAB) family NADH-FMN oxidoreductase RutF
MPIAEQGFVMTATVPGLEPTQFRNIFRRHPAGVVVITLDAGHGPVGFTATSLSSLSLEPPLVSFGIGIGTSSWPHVSRASTVVVNFLGAHQEDVARTFATSGIDRFAAPTAWTRLAEGEPLLAGTAGWLRVTVTQTVAAGDHRIVIGRVESASLSDGHRPLIYHDGSYHSI